MHEKFLVLPFILWLEGIFSSGIIIFCSDTLRHSWDISVIQRLGVIDYVFLLSLMSWSWLK